MQQIALSTVPFTFKYVDGNGASNSLYVQASIYDVTTGTAVFVTKIAMSSVGFGEYAGAYTGSFGQLYLVICAVYTSNAYTTLAYIYGTTYYPASTSEYQCVASGATYTADTIIFDYTDFGQSPSLYLQATVEDMTSGSPVSAGTVSMAYVAFGCYFGSFTGTDGHTYSIAKIVYTDGTFSTPDPNREPASSDGQCYTFLASVPTDNVHIRLNLAGRVSQSNNVRGQISELITVPGRPLAGRVSTSNNLGAVAGSLL